MPKGRCRRDMTNESTTIINCHLCDYKITKKTSEAIVRKYLKLHHKVVHNNPSFSDKDINELATVVNRNYKTELGDVTSRLHHNHTESMNYVKLQRLMDSWNG